MSDPVDEPVILQVQGLVQEVIEGELHTEDITRDAIARLSTLQVPEYRTGAVHARETPDWVYGVSRRSVAPLKNGMNFSYNALYKGTGRDEEALPAFLRERYLDQTETIVKERREKAKASFCHKKAPRRKE